MRLTSVDKATDTLTYTVLTQTMFYTQLIVLFRVLEQLKFRFRARVLENVKII